MILLEVRDLAVSYRVEGALVRALQGVTFSLDRGQAIGIVGESGSGKSTLGLSLLRLLPKSALLSGQALLNGADVLTMNEKTLRRKIRGKTVGMVFQDSLAALNPVYTIGSQLSETIRDHDNRATRAEALQRAGDTLETMSISRDKLRAYPHEFSGGMRQRVGIALAMACDPSVLIVDEGTTDLDLVSQLNILEQLDDLRQRRGVALVVISHDLSVVNYLCDTVVVLRFGRVLESGPSSQVFNSPKDPYTSALVKIARRQRDKDGRLYTLQTSLS